LKNTAQVAGAKMKNEIWKNISVNSSYKISSYGKVIRVWKNGKQKELKLFFNHKGYLRATIMVNGKSKQFFVHRLVLEAFVGPCPKGFQTGHLDGKKDNNNINNLKWVSPKENQEHKKMHGTYLSGKTGPGAKLTEEQVRIIRKEYYFNGSRYGNCAELAKRFNVSKITISEAATGKTWKNLENCK